MAKKKASTNINENDIAKLKEYAEEKTQMIKLNDIKEQETKSEYYNILENDKNHLPLKILSLIIVLSVAILCVYKLVISDSKFILTNNITKIYERLANNLVKISNSEILTSKYNLYGVLEFNSDDKSLSIYNDYLYKINFDVDKNNKNYSFNASIEKDSNNILDATYLVSNNNQYLKLNKIYNTITIDDNIIKIDPRFNDLLRDYDLSKLNNAAKQIKNIINKHIDKKYLSKDKNTITLSLSKEEYSALLSQIIDEIKDNNNIINNLATTFKLSNSDVIKDLDRIIQNNLENKFDNIKIIINTTGLFYTTTSYQLLIDDKEIFNLNTNDLTFTFNYNDTNINFYKEDKYKANINNNIYLTFNELSYDTIDVDYKLNNNDYGNVHFNKYSKSENKSGKLTYSLVTKNSKTSFNFDYRFENYNPIVIDNPTDYKTISEEDYLNIINKINEQVTIKPIANYITSTLEKINK